LSGGCFIFFFFSARLRRDHPQDNPAFAARVIRISTPISWGNRSRFLRILLGPSAFVLLVAGRQSSRSASLARGTGARTRDGHSAGGGLGSVPGVAASSGNF
jgi:hypothetical protein